ncbi:hypothetical protein BC832DRAFT_553431 [Gaertneriomyces semiglobifer]|nr:hypothetical protein BC832DRAFT_553431 [Gaertneriomyces semiglobifer]
MKKTKFYLYFCCVYYAFIVTGQDIMVDTHRHTDTAKSSIQFNCSMPKWGTWAPVGTSTKNRSLLSRH